MSYSISKVGSERCMCPVYVTDDSVPIATDYRQRLQTCNQILQVCNLIDKNRQSIIKAKGYCKKGWTVMLKQNGLVLCLVCVLLLGMTSCAGGVPQDKAEPPASFTTEPVTVTTTATTTRPTRPTVPAPAAFGLDGVPLIPQHPLYPTGCESAAAVMALQWAGEPVTMDEFVDKHLVKDTKFYYEDGVYYGPDPREVFAGDPRTTSSYGCMSPVIRRAMISALGGDERVEDASGLSMTALCEQYVAQGIPVVVWVSINMLNVYPAASWTTPAGETYTWPANEHCMLLIGYDEENYYFNDPYKGREVTYARSLSESRYDALGKQALAVIPLL